MTAISLSEKKGGKKPGAKTARFPPLFLFYVICVPTAVAGIFSSSTRSLFCSVLSFSSSGGGRWKPGGDASYGQRNGRHFIKMYFGPSHAAGRSVIKEKTRQTRWSAKGFSKWWGRYWKKPPSATDGPKKRGENHFLALPF